MKILGLDTSTVTATCSVIEGDKLLGEYSLSQDMSHSEKLVPMIREIFDGLNMKIKDIDLYGVAIGPGSFTGLRIGVATVKSFAHLFDKPIVGVSTLEALAYNLPYNDIVVPMIDARRNRVYTGIYTWDNEILKEVMAPDLLPIEKITDFLRNYKNIVVNGDGSLLHKEYLVKELKEKIRFATIGQNICRASSVAELAKLKYDKKEVHDYFTLAPDYLRESQAQRELNKK